VPLPLCVMVTPRTGAYGLHVADRTLMVPLEGVTYPAWSIIIPYWPLV